MSALGSLVVKLALEYAQFTQGLDKNEQAALKNAKSVQAAYDKMAGAVEERFQSVKSSIAGAVAGVVSVAGLIAVGQKIREETINAEKEQAQLTAALKSTGEAAGWSQDQLNDMAAALSKVTTYSAGEVNQAQARLLAYVNITGEQVPRAIRAAMDMGTRLEMNLNQSMETVAKALDKPSTGMQSLQRQGFKFTESQIEMAKALENSGRLADAQAIVFAELESSYGGAAEAARDTLGGALTAVGNTINDLLTADSASLPALRNSVEELNRLLNSDASKAAFSFYVQLMVNMATTAGKLAVALADLRNGGLGSLLGHATADNAGSELVSIEGKLNKMRADAAAVDPSKGFTNKLNDFLFGDYGDLQRQIGVLENQREVLLRTVNASEGLGKSYEDLSADNDLLVASLAGTSQQLGKQAVIVGQTDSYLKKYGTSAQKAALEIAEWKSKLGAAFTPEMEARIREAYAKQDAGARGAAQSVKQLQTAYDNMAKGLDEKIASQRLELSTSEKLTDSAKLRIKYKEELKGSLAGLSQVQRHSLDARLKTLATLEDEIEAQQKLAKLAEEERTYRQQWWGDQAKTVDDLNAGNKSLREEIELIGLNAVEQANVLRLRAQSVLLTKEQQLAEMERAAQLTGTMTREQVALQQEIELLRERLVLTGTKEARDASAQAAQASVQEWQLGVNQISQSLTDQLMDGGRTFGEYLKNLGRTLIFRPVIQAIVQPVGSSVTSMLGLGPQTVGANGAAGMLGGVNSLSSLYSAVSGGLVSSVGGAIGTLGTMLGSNALTSFAAGMKGASLAAGLAGPTTAGASGVMGLGATVASALPWVAGGLAVLSLAGGLKGIFGGKVTKRGEGIDGQLGGDLRAYADYKKSGGWFGSNKYWTDYGAMEGNAQIQATFAALQTSITQQAKGLGVSADAVATYTRKIRFSTEGLSGDQVAARLQEEMTAAGEEMAALVLGTAQYTKAGEAATATLQRLTGSLGVVNTTLEVTRGKLFDVGLAGASMASDLVDRFGGLDAYISASEAYYQAYYTQAERANQSTDAMRKQLEALGLTLPESREQFRQLVGSLDLTTASGREAYATLIKMAPQFDETATMLDELARAAAADLIATYTKAAAVAPGMKIAQDAMAAVVTQSDRFAGSVSTINKILGDSSSGVLVFGDRVQTVTSALDPAQLAVQRLRAEIMDMQASASGTVVDIDGLAKALDGVDVRTFSATVVGVFDLIANRIRSNLADIASEREAVREAAISIIAPRVMTPAQIREQIKAQTVALPNQNGIAAAQAALAKADTLVKQREAEWSAAVANNTNRSPGLYNSAAQLEAKRGNAARNLVATYLRFGKVQDGVWGESMSGGLAGLATYNDTQANMLAKMQNLPTAEIQAFADQLTRLGKSGLSDGYTSTATYLQMMESYKAATASEAANQAKAAGLREQAAALAAKATTAEQALAAARAQQSAATGNAQKAQLDYVAALQKYSMDSGKAVSNLSKLREETVAWYQSQAQLAQTMGDSAAGLRQTVADVRFGMLDTPAQFANLQERFNVAYSMAMSTSGETLAGYGNELNSLLNPLLQKAQEAGLSSSEYSSLVQTMLARAEAVANRLDKEAPKNYQEESLGLLGQIDSTLAALEAGAKSTEQLMVEAIKAGTDTTRDGLRAVIAVLRGQAVPAFAEGGLHAGGLRLVGERGRELEVTGAARYYSAEQTARLLAGAQPPVVAQLMQSPGVDLRPLVDEVQQLRREVTGLLQRVGGATEAVAVNTGRLQRNVDRITVEGMPVRNVENEHLVVQVEAADAADPAN